MHLRGACLAEREKVLLEAFVSGKQFKFDREGEPGESVNIFLGGV